MPETKYLLNDNQIPAAWLNVLPLLEQPMDPPLHPGTKQPLTPGDLAPLFDERNQAVKRIIGEAITKAHAAGIKIGICGQAPSNYPEFAGFLVEQGIDSISLNPDSFVATARHVAATEQRLEHLLGARERSR